MKYNYNFLIYANHFSKDNIHSLDWHVNNLGINKTKTFYAAYVLPKFPAISTQADFINAINLSLHTKAKHTLKAIQSTLNLSNDNLLLCSGTATKQILKLIKQLDIDIIINRNGEQLTKKWIMKKPLKKCLKTLLSTFENNNVPINSNTSDKSNFEYIDMDLILRIFTMLIPVMNQKNFNLTHEQLMKYCKDIYSNVLYMPMDKHKKDNLIRMAIDSLVHELNDAKKTTNKNYFTC